MVRGLRINQLNGSEEKLPDSLKTVKKFFFDPSKCSMGQWKNSLFFLYAQWVSEKSLWFSRVLKWLRKNLSNSPECTMGLRKNFLTLQSAQRASKKNTLTLQSTQGVSEKIFWHARVLNGYQKKYSNPPECSKGIRKITLTLHSAQ